MYRQWVLTALLAWPALAALVVVLAPARWAKHLALAASLVEFAISAPLWWTFVPAGGMQFILDAPWIPSWGIRYTVGVDGISLFMVLLTTFLVPLSVLGSYAYITTRERGFYALMLVLTTGMIGVFVALDLFLFYVMWEVMLIPMYFIIGVWGGERRLYAAIKFFVYTFFGSLLMLVAILALVSIVGQRTGVYSFSYTHLTTHSGGLGSLAFWLFGAFFLAFAIKVPMFPFHTWLPDAHVEAPTAGSVLLAGVLLKMGTYGFLRFALPLFPAVALHPAVQRVIVALSLIGILYGGVVAMVQPDFKKLIAYSSVAHLGFVMLGIWALTLQSVQGALLVMINHGISTGALFFLAGMLYERRHSRLIDAFGGVAKVVPLLAAALTIVPLSSIGRPPSISSSRSGSTPQRSRRRDEPRSHEQRRPGARPPARAGADRGRPARPARDGVAAHERPGPADRRMGDGGRPRRRRGCRVVAVVAHRTGGGRAVPHRGGRLPLRHGRPVPRRRGAHRARLVRLPGARRAARAGVLRPAVVRDPGHDADGGRGRPDGDLPRARADVGGGVRARGDRPQERRRRRGGTQVLSAGGVRLGVPAVRHRARVRRDRDDQFDPDRHAGALPFPGAEPDAAARSGTGARRVRVQGGGGAVPHVGARCVRRLSHTRDRVHGHRGESRRLRGPVPRAGRGVHRRGGLEADRVVARRGDHDRGQFHRAGPAYGQAHARILIHRPRRVRAGGGPGGDPGRIGPPAGLSLRLHARDPPGGP